MIRPAFTEIGIFLIPFAVYALFLFATRSGLLAQSSWPLHFDRQAVLGSLLLVVISLVLLAHFSGGAAEFDLHSRAYRERQARSRSGKMSDARVLGDAPWLTSGPAARVLAIAQRRRRGSARGRRRSPQRAVEDSDRRYRYRHHRAARRSDPPRQGGRHQERADRHRARHRDAGRRRAAVRGHDPARGHRDLRPQGQGRVRPRLGRATPSGATSPSTACRSMPAASCTITSAGLTISRQGGCASSAIRTGGSPRTICASCGSSAFTPPTARASPIATAISPAFAARAGLATLSAERVRMEMLKLMIAEGAAGAVTAMADGGLLLPIFGGVAYTGPFAAMIAAERALGLKPTRFAGSARSRSPSPRTQGALRRACGSPTPKPRRWIRWAIAGGGSPAWTRRPRGGGSIGSARTVTATG